MDQALQPDYTRALSSLSAFDISERPYSFALLPRGDTIQQTAGTMDIRPLNNISHDKFSHDIVEKAAFDHAVRTQITDGVDISSELFKRPKVQPASNDLPTGIDFALPSLTPTAPIANVAQKSAGAQNDINRSGSETRRRALGPRSQREQRPSDALGSIADTRSTPDALDAPSESSTTPGPQTQLQLQPLQNVEALFPVDDTNGNSISRPVSALPPSTPKHPSVLTPNSMNGKSSRDSKPIIPSSASPSYQPPASLSMPVSIPIPISPNARANVQQPTYITPPSSPTPIAVNPVYSYTPGPSPYTPDAATPATNGQVSVRMASTGTFAAQQLGALGVMGVPGVVPEGREICVECAMRDQDMADVDVTGPGVWDRESDVFYHELCRREAEEAEERARAKASNSSSESHAILRSIDPGRPRAHGNRLTEQNLKLWLTMVCHLRTELCNVYFSPVPYYIV